jgi:deoxyadenosine/deoxycytidine kinase
MNREKLTGKFRYLVVEGNIGAGKTTLATRLAADTGGELILEEFAENSFLPRFYEDPERFAFPLELSFLAARYRQLTEHFSNNPGVPVISDYHIAKSLLFAKTNLGSDELKLFESFYAMVSAKIPEPDLVLFLDNRTDQLQKNISKRARNYEQRIPDSYLNSIGAGYEKLIQSRVFGRHLRIDSHSLDFINNESDYLFIINQLNSLK